MATIDDKILVDKIIAANGRLWEEDPPVLKIVEYTNVFDGRKAWGIISEGESLGKYVETEFVRNPVTIWEQEEK